MRYKIYTIKSTAISYTIYYNLFIKTQLNNVKEQKIFKEEQIPIRTIVQLYPKYNVC